MRVGRTVGGGTGGLVDTAAPGGGRTDVPGGGVGRVLRLTGQEAGPATGWTARAPRELDLRLPVRAAALALAPGAGARTCEVRSLRAELPCLTAVRYAVPGLARSASRLSSQAPITPHPLHALDPGVLWLADALLGVSGPWHQRALSLGTGPSLGLTAVGSSACCARSGCLPDCSEQCCCEREHGAETLLQLQRCVKDPHAPVSFTSLPTHATPRGADTHQATTAGTAFTSF